jgi:hypothetical protein
MILDQVTKVEVDSCSYLMYALHAELLACLVVVRMAVQLG